VSDYTRLEILYDDDQNSRRIFNENTIIVTNRTDCNVSVKAFLIRTSGSCMWMPEAGTRRDNFKGAHPVRPSLFSFKLTYLATTLLCYVTAYYIIRSSPY
jgi:hypothetical protein